MIMQDFKNVKSESEKLSAWDYLAALGFISTMLFLIIL
jgi:hypothetical protein